MANTPNLKKLYQDEVAPALMQKFGYKSTMQIPRLEKIVLNVGCSEARENAKVLDAVVYRFDYSKVALIITKEYDAVAEAIGTKLDRGATFLNGEGSYSHEPTKVVLAAVKKQQVTELKELVMAIDPNAFVIVQEAHQVLGDGFSHYSKQSL